MSNTAANALPPLQMPTSEKKLKGEFGTYLANPKLIAAANVALSLEMPLLLTGKPGCGKTDFAYVMARVVAERAITEGHVRGDQSPVDPYADDFNFRDDAGYGLLECNLRTDTRARDLLYSYDAMVRFGDSQHGDEDMKETARDPRNYLEMEPLGIALMSRHPRVVLIDEIDKAPRDLPNDLLREIERGEFDIHELPRNRRPSMPEEDVNDPITGAPWHRRMRRVRKPVVIVTSNDERQLPEAFLRRCAFCHIPFPDKTRLLDIVKARIPNPGPLRLDTIVDISLRAHEIPNLIKPTSTAEMLNWAQALLRSSAPKAAADKLNEIAKELAEGKPLPWEDLPGISCLFKTKADLDTATKATSA